MSFRMVQLQAIRSLVELLIQLEEAEQQQQVPQIVKQPSACPHCGAPEEMQADAATLANRTGRLCLKCQQEWAA